MHGKAGVPIIPVGIKGSFKPFTKVTIHYGEPIDVSNLDLQDRDAVDAFTVKVMNEVVRLTNEEK